MSSHLGWEPAVVQPLGGTLSTAMKHALADRFHIANVDDVADGLTLDETDVDWLRGVTIGRGEGDDLYDDAVQLIEAIRRHGTIRMRRA